MGRGSRFGGARGRAPGLQLTIPGRVALRYTPPMNLSRFRELCLALPGVTEQLQWGDDAVFKVGGRMFSVAATSRKPRYVCSFKADPDTFAELCERIGLAPAPYLARAQWVAAEEWDALSDAEYGVLLPKAYDIIKAKLPRRVQGALASSGSSRAAAASKRAIR
jgi:predicted DNA-binding protein (MmcQ/YjbR family)